MTHSIGDGAEPGVDRGDVPHLGKEAGLCEMGDILGHGESTCIHISQTLMIDSWRLTESSPSAWVDDSLHELAPDKGLLLLEQQRVSLVWDPTDVERVTGIGDKLAKVGGVVWRVILCVRLLNESGDSGSGRGWTVVHTGEELGSLHGSWVDAGDGSERALDEGSHGVGG